MSEQRQEHWGGVYRRKPVTGVSWFEPEPQQSLELIAGCAIPADAPVLDVGGGASVLVDRLLAAGYQDVTVLDVAAEALAVSRDRLGARAGRADWVVADLLSWRPARRYALWHDRAVFHFLVDEAARDRYRQTLTAALTPDTRVIVGTFAADGPDRCSDLPTARYTPGELAGQFPGFDVLTTARQEHRTPAGGIQPFSWVVLRRGAADDDPDPRA